MLYSMQWKSLAIEKNDVPTVAGRWCMPGGKLEKMKRPFKQ